MKALDRELQRQRFARAMPFIEPGSAVVDLGCNDGAFFAAARDRLSRGVGVDLQQPETWVEGPFECRVGEFTEVFDAGETFDAIVALAVVEHIPRDGLDALAKVVPDILRPGGRMIITTPSPRVDEILHVLTRLRIIDGMEVHEHYGFDPRTVPEIFAIGPMQLETHTRFQLGLNHLFVFRKS